MSNLTEYLNPVTALRIFEANRAKGFWGENPHDRNTTEVLALIVSELYEGFEALRKNKVADEGSVMSLYTDYFIHDKPFDEIGFKQFIKDTVEDEVADAAIRALDLYGYTQWTIDPNIEHGPMSPVEPIFKDTVVFLDNDSYAALLLRVGSRVHMFDKETTVLESGEFNLRSKMDVLRHCAEYVLKACMTIADELGFLHSLKKHIELKLAFNATRPYKHGKAF